MTARIPIPWQVVLEVRAFYYVSEITIQHYANLTLDFASYLNDFVHRKGKS